MRLDRVRAAIAQFFDHPSSHHHFDTIESVTIEFAPGFRSTAVLLAGWFGAQLDWKIEKAAPGNNFKFVDSDGRKIAVALPEKAGEPINRVVFVSKGVEFVVSHSPGADLLQLWRGAPGEECTHQLMPAGKNELVSLMSDELMRGGPHRVYVRAVSCVRELL